MSAPTDGGQSKTLGVGNKDGGSPLVSAWHVKTECNELDGTRCGRSDTERRVLLATCISQDWCVFALRMFAHPSRRSSLLSWASFGSKATLDIPATPTDTSDASVPSTPTGPTRSSSFSSSRRASITSLTPQDVDPQNSQNGNNSSSSRIASSSANELPRSNSKGSFGKTALSSMIGNISNFSSASLRDRSDEREGGRGRRRSASQARPSSKDGDERSTRTRSVSPFFLRRSRRDPSPHIEALPQSDFESDTESIDRSKRPRNSAFTLTDDSASEGEGEGSETDASEESWFDGDPFDDITESNTERNALTTPADPAEDVDGADIDPLGEGVNVVVPPEPLFPTTLHGGHGGRRSTGLTRKKTMRPEHLPLNTSRPVFQRNRCTIWLTNGDPIASLKGCPRRPRRYVVASDLSVESKYAVEWCIGTVMRDGDEMILVTVTEAENKLDPLEGGTVDRVARLRNQQERQTLAYLLVRQVTSLLQRTRLNVTVVCQAWHAKNSRHLLLDLVDFTEPTMLIVGSRGLGKVKGILLGSTSHYLIQRSSVPVMVARRRLKRPPKRNAHLSSHRARVPLSEAAIDKAPSKVENDVAAMRDEIARDDAEQPEREEGELDPEAEGVAEGSKSPAKATLTG